MNASDATPVPEITNRILVIREQRVILDVELARLYGAPTKRFNEAFKRNRDRFPGDFVFQLTAAEFAAFEPVAICDQLHASFCFFASYPQLVTNCDQLPSTS